MRGAENKTVNTDRRSCRLLQRMNLRNSFEVLGPVSNDSLRNQVAFLLSLA